MGRGVYGMFGQKLLLRKSKRLCNPIENRWKAADPEAVTSPDGLKINSGIYCLHIFAEKGFAIAGDNFRMDKFPGTVLYYYEVTHVENTLRGHSLSYWLPGTFIGLSEGSIHPDIRFSCVGKFANSYSIPSERVRGPDDLYCFLSRHYYHKFEWPTDAIKPQFQDCNYIIGCGLVLSPANKLSIFFTINGILIGKQIPIAPSVHHLFPTVRKLYVPLEANFGDDPTKPFKYDIDKCTGLILSEI